MKLQEALELIETIPLGYRIEFNVIDGEKERWDSFPDVEIEEELIRSYDEALDLAQKFARVNPSKYVNIIVVAKTSKGIMAMTDPLNKRNVRSEWWKKFCIPKPEE